MMIKLPQQEMSVEALKALIAAAEQPQPVEGQVYRLRGGTYEYRYCNGQWERRRTPTAPFEDASQSVLTSWWRGGRFVPYVPPPPTFKVGDWIYTGGTVAKVVALPVGAGVYGECYKVRFVHFSHEDLAEGLAKPSELRHATPEEIAAATRIEPVVGTLHATNFKPPRETAAERQARHRARAAARKAAKYGRIKKDATKIDYSVFALAKGKTSDEQYAEDHAAEVKQIRKTREKVWRRTDHCEYCGDSEAETALKHPKATHEMNEDPPRSKTRGLPPEQRFNIYNCGRACAICHQLITDNVIVIHFHDEERRHMGDYDIIDKASGHILRHMRRGVDARPRAQGAST